MFFGANKKWAIAHSSLPSISRCDHGTSVRRNKIVANPMIHPLGFYFNGAIFFGWCEVVVLRGVFGIWVFGSGEFLVNVWWIGWVGRFLDGLFFGGVDYADS
jgi:hypothetical protein